MFECMRNMLVYSAVLSLSTGAAMAYAKCPQPVNSAIQKAYPGSKVQSCKQKKGEKKDKAGRKQYEATVMPEGAAQIVLDLTPDGAIMLTEEVVMMDSVPAIVVAAFQEKYPKAAVTIVEMQTDSAGVVNYELAFKEEGKGKSHDATFSKDGKFIEED